MKIGKVLPIKYQLLVFNQQGEQIKFPITDHAHVLHGVRTHDLRELQLDLHVDSPQEEQLA